VSALSGVGHQRPLMSSAFGSGADGVAVALLGTGGLVGASGLAVLVGEAGVLASGALDGEATTGVGLALGAPESAPGAAPAWHPTRVAADRAVRPRRSEVGSLVLWLGMTPIVGAVRIVGSVAVAVRPEAVRAG